MRILVVITARGGSVTLPRKNVLPFCGKPLIAHTILAAVEARAALPAIDRLIVSTDDEEVAEIGRRWGAEVPFIRPAELARSDTPSLPVVQHTVQFAESEAGQRYDWVLLLQPTSPLRTAEDIKQAVDLAQTFGTTAVIGVTLANSSHPFKLRRIDRDGLLRPYLREMAEQNRRQNLPFDVYRTNGAIYLADRDCVMEQGSFYGPRPRPYIMPAARSIDIDEKLDFDIAEFLYSRSRAVQDREAGYAHAGRDHSNR